MEYHQPRTAIRDKELALNYACSFLRPIDDRLLSVIKEVAASKKMRMNIDLGKQMMTELRFWQLDPFDVGDESDDDEEGDGDEDITTLLSKGLDAEDEDSRKSMAEQMLAAMDNEARLKERREILEGEMNISEFQVEPEVEQCMTDFYRKPYAEVHEVQAVEQEVKFEQPVQYYDNEDGFWDEYIDWKHARWDSDTMLVNRKFFRH